MSDQNKTHKTSVGGQAVIEGIMMRGPKGLALSVRVPDGSISTEYKNRKSAKERLKFLGWPLVRGVVGFVESMIIGYDCLMTSAEKSGLAQEEKEPGKFEKILGDKLFGVIAGLSSILGIALAMVLFMWAPSAIFGLVNTHLAGGKISYYQALFEGIMRIGIFVLYTVVISRLKDIHRVFEYHGAEHKTIFCYENGLDLTVDNVKAQRRFHPRCGTSFIFVMLILGIVISTLLTFFTPVAQRGIWVWVGVKILILPLVMGFGYEFIKFAGRHDGPLVRALSMPGLWMQRITTKEPDTEQIEVAIDALKAVITDNPEDDAI